MEDYYIKLNKQINWKYTTGELDKMAFVALNHEMEKNVKVQAIEATSTIERELGLISSQ